MSFEQALDPELNAFVFVYRGTARIADQDIPRLQMAILANEGDGVRISSGEGPMRALLIAGRPLREPIAQYGPFVMNTRDELIQAVDDFQNGRLR